MKRMISLLILLLGIGTSLHAQYPYTLQQCLEEGLMNNYSLRISRNEEQISKNNATLGNAGFLPAVDLTAGYSGNLDNTDTEERSTGNTVSNRGVSTRRSMPDLMSAGHCSTVSTSVPPTSS